LFSVILSAEKQRMQETKYHIQASTMEEEKALILLAMDDVKHFEKLYNRYFLPIFKYIFNRVRSEEKTAEITSDVFAKAINNIKKYKDKQVPFVAWLYGIARNEMLQHFRKQNKEVVVFVEEDKLRYFSEELDAVNKELLFLLMKKVMSMLPPEDVEIIELKYFQQLSHKEIGEILVISEENARIKCFRVIKKLKELVNKMGEV